VASVGAGHCFLHPCPPVGSCWQQSVLETDLSETSRVFAVLTARAPLQVALSNNLIDAASRLADGLLALSAGPPLESPAAQATLLFACDVVCSLAASPCSPTFSLSTCALRGIVCSSVGGVPGALLLSMTAGTMELASRKAAGPPTALVHLPDNQPPDSESSHAAQLSLVLR
jgi:hypothetical protein